MTDMKGENMSCITGMSLNVLFLSLSVNYSNYGFGCDAIHPMKLFFTWGAWRQLSCSLRLRVHPAARLLAPLFV